MSIKLTIHSVKKSGGQPKSSLFSDHSGTEQSLMATQATVQQEILQLKHIPPLSATATQLLEAASDPEVEVEHIAGIIGQDPPLSARILGMANAAYFMGTQPVYTIKEAIIRVLGLNLVKGLALSMAMTGSIDTRACHNFDLTRYWVQALGCAALSRMIALKINPRQPLNLDALYLCGLLQNLGTLVLAYLFPQPLSSVLAIAKEDPDADILALEEQHIGISHTAMGEQLAIRWHLPEMVVHTIAGLDRHHSPGAYHTEVILINRTAAWAAQYAAKGKNALKNDTLLSQLEGIDESMLTEIEAQFHSQYGELQATARMLN